MSDLLLTTEHDLDPSITLVDGVEAISQQLRIRLQIFLGEWFLDAREGIPFFRDVFIKNPNLSVVREIFRRAISTTPNILSVDKLILTLDPAQRHLRVDFSATTTSGAIITLSPFIIEI